MPVAPFERHRAWFILLQFFSLPVIGWWLGTAFGAAWLCNLLTPFWVFMVFPQLDAWIGLDTRNPCRRVRGRACRRAELPAVATGRPARPWRDAGLVGPGICRAGP
jgi:hypothetical protein